MSRSGGLGSRRYGLDESASSVRILLGASDDAVLLRHRRGMWFRRGRPRGPSSPSSGGTAPPPTYGNFDYQLGEAYAPEA
jgi:hypothetical protein